MGPSRPDFLCVLPADNGICQRTNRRLRAGGGLWGVGVPAGRLGQGWGSCSPGTSGSNPEAAADFAGAHLVTLGPDGPHV